MRKIRPESQSVNTMLTHRSTSVPTRSNSGGSAAARFIITNGVNSGIHDRTTASVPFGSRATKIIVRIGTISTVITGAMMFCASLSVLHRDPSASSRLA